MIFVHIQTKVRARIIKVEDQSEIKQKVKKKYLMRECENARLPPSKYARIMRSLCDEKLKNGALN